MLKFEVRSPFDRHRAADVFTSFVDLGSCEPQSHQHVESVVVELFVGKPQILFATVLSQGELVERERELKRVFERAFDFGESFGREALGLERFGVDMGSAAQRLVSDAISNDILDLLLAVTEPSQRGRDGLVDDLEVAPSRQLLELDEREIGLDAGGVAIHQEPDGSRRSEHGHLGVAEPVSIAQRGSAVPRLTGCLEHVRRALVRVDPDRKDGEALKLARRRVVGGSPMVANDTKHRVSVPGIPRKRPKLSRHLRANGVRLASKNRSQSSTNRPSLRAIVWDPHLHQQRAEVRVTQAQRAKLVTQLRDLWAGKLGHEHADFEHEGPEPNRVTIALNVKQSGLRVVEPNQVDRGKVASRVVEEHIFRARIARVDPAVRRARVPLVDGRIVLNARVGARPRRIADLIPKVFRTNRLGHFAVGAPDQLPLPVAIDRPKELVRNSD
ncbi:MAG: hypothetical protein CNCCGFBP_00168 [Fimbriimonadaceae bacterium]|nr:hypothetical protein [Fimbriimonadaceae bacterium]